MWNVYEKVDRAEWESSYSSSAYVLHRQTKSGYKDHFHVFSINEP